MYYNLLKICALVLVLREGVLGQNCADCIDYKLCPAALNLVDNEAGKLLRQAFCGFEVIDNLRIVKVCCSMLPSTTADEAVHSEDMRIENHKNLHLLPGECGNIPIHRILTPDYRFDYLWMALIGHETHHRDRFICTGSIINKRYVLTAAHCVHNKTITAVRVGVYDLQDNDLFRCYDGECKSDYQDLPVEKVVIHENYRHFSTVRNNIALIRLADDLDFQNQNVDMICLPKTSELRQESLVNKDALVAGWGITERYTEPTFLHVTQVQIHTAEDCTDFVNRFTSHHYLTTDKICVRSSNKNFCNSDPGGPLFLETKYNNIERYVQYGIFSQGPMLCGSDYPGQYTDVTKFMGWILDNMES